MSRFKVARKQICRLRKSGRWRFFYIIICSFSRPEVVIYLYSSPERYVNHVFNPNIIQDLNRKCDAAKRDIKKGEEITADAMKDEIS